MRPLAVVMVADPTPLTVANLRTLSTWCDLLLTEGTRTNQGVAREPLRSGWRQLLGLEPPQLRVLTTDLGGTTRPRRQATQRNSAMAVLGQEPDERWVLILDADELLDRDCVEAEIARGPEDPARLGLVPLYGAVDRVAARIHCCWNSDWPDLRKTGPDRPYVLAGPSLATAAMMRGALPSRVRFRSRPTRSERPFGLHVTMCDPIAQVAWKLANMRHVWDPRVLGEQHLDTMLAAGVHHAGWWIAAYREPEPWLLDLAGSSGLRVAGPPAPDPHRRALRAWAEARLDPLVPDEFVRAGDAYVAGRPHDALDFLGALDEWLLSRPVMHCGHLDDADAHDPEDG
jgi:hypothetical protein